ncbi:hypothetical protein AAD018_009895 [Aestuariibius insulae]|uniref:hypothetical protein n=1 Tax=Aestuariibius insulae TaxID=2058287 RepID=UPI00398F0FBE
MSKRQKRPSEEFSLVKVKTRYTSLTCWSLTGSDGLATFEVMTHGTSRRRQLERSSRRPNKETYKERNEEPLQNVARPVAFSDQQDQFDKCIRKLKEQIRKNEDLIKRIAEYK